MVPKKNFKKLFRKVQIIFFFFNKNNLTLNNWRNKMEFVQGVMLEKMHQNVVNFIKRG